MYKALTVIALPVLTADGDPTGETIRKEPGSTITKKEWKDAGQTDEDFAAMEAAGSISEDMDAELHPQSRPVPAGTASLAQMIEQAKQMVELLGEDAPEEIRALAEKKVVNAEAENAKGGDKSGS